MHAHLESPFRIFIFSKLLPFLVEETGADGFRGKAVLTYELILHLFIPDILEMEIDILNQA